MKTSLLISIAFPLLSWAAATPNPGADSLESLSKRADKWCRLHDSVDPPGNCRTCASTHCKSIKTIQRSDNFGVKCYMMGDKANNNQ